VHGSVALMLIHMYMYGWNLYMRKRAHMDHTFLFEFSRGSELHSEETLVVCTTPTTVLIGATVTHLGIHYGLFHAQASADVDLIHSCGSYVGQLQNWISSRSEEQIWLEKLPNQICSRRVECNASCLVVCIGLGNTFLWVNSGASHGINELQ
jgi:hypothetical protein